MHINLPVPKYREIFFIFSLMMKLPVFLLLIAFTLFTYAQDSLTVQPDSLAGVIADSAAVVKPLTVSPELMPEKKKFKIERVRILLGANYTFYNPLVNQKDIFRGEFREDEDSAAVFVDRNNTYNINKYLPVRNFQMTLQGNSGRVVYRFPLPVFYYQKI